MCNAEFKIEINVLPTFLACGSLLGLFFLAPVINPLTFERILLCFIGFGFSCSWTNSSHLYSFYFYSVILLISQQPICIFHNLVVYPIIHLIRMANHSTPLQNSTSTNLFNQRVQGGLKSQQSHFQHAKGKSLLIMLHLKQRKRKKTTSYRNFEHL